MKKVLTVLAVLMMCVGIAFASGSAEGNGPKVTTLKISISESPADIKSQLINDMIKEMEELSGGELKFELYCSNELGSLGDVVEQTKIGANIISGTSGDFYASYGAPDIMATALPYVITTVDECENLNNSDLFKEWADAIEAESGLKLFNIGWCSTPRDIISIKPINSIDDLSGFKIRIPGAAMDAFFSALDASTMSMSFSDVYTSMQQGMIDGAEAGISGLYSYSLQEVGKYVFMSEHSLAPAVWSMSSAVWNSLSEENQKILVETFEKYSRIYAEKGLELQQEYIDKMKAEGVTFVYPSDADKTAMADAAAEAMASFPELSEGLSDRIAEAMK